MAKECLLCCLIRGREDMTEEELSDKATEIACRITKTYKKEGITICCDAVDTKIVATWLGMPTDGEKKTILDRIKGIFRK